jgi:hypothetical protein
VNTKTTAKEMVIPNFPSKNSSNCTRPTPVTERVRSTPSGYILPAFWGCQLQVGQKWFSVNRIECISKIFNWEFDYLPSWSCLFSVDTDLAVVQLIFHIIQY